MNTKSDSDQKAQTSSSKQKSSLSRRSILYLSNQNAKNRLSVRNHPVSANPAAIEQKSESNSQPPKIKQSEAILRLTTADTDNTKPEDKKKLNLKLPLHDKKIASSYLLKQTAGKELICLSTEVFVSTHIESERFTNFISEKEIPLSFEVLDNLLKALIANDVESISHKQKGKTVKSIQSFHEEPQQEILAILKALYPDLELDADQIIRLKHVRSDQEQQLEATNAEENNRLLNTARASTKTVTSARFIFVCTTEAYQLALIDIHHIAGFSRLAVLHKTDYDSVKHYSLCLKNDVILGQLPENAHLKELYTKYMEQLNPQDPDSSIPAEAASNLGTDTPTPQDPLNSTT